MVQLRYDNSEKAAQVIQNSSKPGTQQTRFFLQERQVVIEFSVLKESRGLQDP